MSTTTPVREDTDIASLIDAAVPPPTCEWKSDADVEPCGAPATWIMSSACGHSAYFDDEHGEAMRRHVRTGGRNYCANDAPPRHPRMTPADPIRFRPVAS